MFFFLVKVLFSVGLLALLVPAACGEVSDARADPSESTSSKVQGTQTFKASSDINNDSGFITERIVSNSGEVILAFTCSGVLLSRGVVLTAAHCVIKNRPEQNQTRWTDSNWIFSRDLDSTNSPQDHARSVTVQVPSGVSNYSNSQWASAPVDEAQISVDYAILSLFGDISPRGTGSVIAGSTVSDGTPIRIDGYGTNNNNQKGHHYFGYTTTQANASGDVSGLYKFSWGSQESAYSMSGDSGGPIFMIDNNYQTRTIISIVSTIGIPSKGASLTSFSSAEFLSRAVLRGALDGASGLMSTVY